jgi:hypothetical protein
MRLKSQVLDATHLMQSRVPSALKNTTPEGTVQVPSIYALGAYNGNSALVPSFSSF